MGMVCPECKERVAIVATITADGLGAKKAEDVIAQRLACGHVVGGEDYEEFIKARNELMIEAKQAKLALDREVKGKVAALWKQIKSGDEEVNFDAE